MNNHQNGFTLIEMIVVIGVFTLMIPLLFSIIFTTLREQIKVVHLVQIKQEGDFALDNIEKSLRGYGKQIYRTFSPGPPFSFTNQQCASFGSTYTSSTSGRDFYIQDKFGNMARYYINSGDTKISSDSALVSTGNTTTSPLSSGKAIISNFSISCTYNGPVTTQTFSVPATSIKVQFDICYNNNNSPPCSSVRSEDITSLHYQSTMRLRN